jgi:hypothetical protein
VRTTTRTNWRFSFTISDLGRFLCKSPVTLRGWESRGFIAIPRDSSGDRRLTTDDIRHISEHAYANRRISKHRAELVAATMTMVEMIEHENNRKAKQR